MDIKETISLLERSANIKMIPVESSVIFAYGIKYNKLYLLFKFGNNSLQGKFASIYELTNDEIESFKNANSKGSWLNANLLKKNRKYYEHIFR